MRGAQRPRGARRARVRQARGRSGQGHAVAGERGAAPGLVLLLPVLQLPHPPHMHLHDTAALHIPHL